MPRRDGESKFADRTRKRRKRVGQAKQKLKALRRQNNDKQ